jgi:hypothetical protein
VPTSTTLSVIAIPFLVALATWLSLRALGAADVRLLPVPTRIRIAWCLRHHRQLDAVCVLVAAFAAIVAVVAGLHAGR